MHWRRKWQPTSVFLPGESQGQRSLVGCRLWGRTELDTTEATAAAAAAGNGHLLRNSDAQTVKNLPAMQEIWVQSLGQEDPLEDGMATHFSVLAWRIPGMGEPGGLPSMGSHRVGHD